MEITAELVRGAVEIERTETGVRPHRLPEFARRQADAQFELVEAQPAGVRIVFRSAATRVTLVARAERFGYVGVPLRAPGVFDVLVDGELVASASLSSAVQILRDLTTGEITRSEAEPEELTFELGVSGGVERLVEIWLPYSESVELISIDADEPLAPAHRPAPTWVHYGSSISQGSNAASAATIWTAVAARLGGVELTNLGFGGSALLDPFVARTIRDLPADLISVKVGINIVNADLMRRRAFAPALHGFLDVIRDGHPDTPLLLVTPLWSPIFEHTPGPGAFDPDALSRGETRFVAAGDPAEVRSGKLDLATIRADIVRVVHDRSASDPNLFQLDGMALYGASDAQSHPLPDDLHPDAATHRLLGERFAEEVFGVEGAIPTTR